MKEGKEKRRFIDEERKKTGKIFKHKVRKGRKVLVNCVSMEGGK